MNTNEIDHAECVVVLKQEIQKFQDLQLRIYNYPPDEPLEGIINLCTDLITAARCMSVVASVINSIEASKKPLK